MTSIRNTALRCIGRPVCVHSRQGIHYGVLHHVDENGIYLRQTRAGTVAWESTPGDRAAEEPTQDEITLAWFPFLFLPWIALWGLYPWGWYW